MNEQKWWEIFSWAVLVAMIVWLLMGGGAAW